MSGLSRRLRFEVLRRDGHTCRYCGAQAPDVVLTVDHVIPTALGGGDEPTNLVTACRDCNSGKSSATADAALVGDVEADALRWARALERSAEYRAMERRAMDDELFEFKSRWDDWTCEGNGDRKPIPLPPNWRETLTRFVALGLQLGDYSEAIRIAMGANVPHENRFRYFCGCCWRMVGELQETARQIIEEDEGVARGQN